MAHDLRAVLRLLPDRNAEPSAVILDGRTLQSTPESGARRLRWLQAAQGLQSAYRGGYAGASAGLEDYGGK